MPNVSEDTISHLERLISSIPPVSTLIHDGQTPEEILSLLSNGTEEILKKTDISYTCNCSKDGFSKSLSALDEETMNEIILEDGHAEIECHFCHTKYLFSKEELIKIKKTRKEK